MPLCFIEPRDAIRVIAESVGREARRQLLGELVRAWVDEIPDGELASHYAKARRRPRRARPVDARRLARLPGGRPADRQQGVPRQRVPVAGRQPARGAEDRRRLPRRGGLRGRRRRGAGARAPSCRGSRASAAWSSPPSASSSTAGTGSAPTTSPRSAVAASAASISAIACAVSRNHTARHPELAGRVAVDLEVVDEQAVAALGQPEPLERQLVDLGIGLAHPDERRVDDQLEDLVDREHRAPQRLPLAHVVGEERHAVARGRAAPRMCAIISSLGWRCAK